MQHHALAYWRPVLNPTSFGTKTMTRAAGFALLEDALKPYVFENFARASHPIFRLREPTPPASTSLPLPLPLLQHDEYGARRRRRASAPCASSRRSVPPAVEQLPRGVDIPQGDHGKAIFGADSCHRRRPAVELRE